MKHFTGIVAIAILAGGLGLCSTVLADDGDGGWTISGIGTTSVETGEDCSVLLKYYWNNPDTPGSRSRRGS